MSSRVERQLTEYRISLEKEVDDKSILDILEVLNKVPINIDLLRSTKIGTVLQEIKKKYSNQEIGSVTKTLLTKWKKECESQLDVKPMDDNLKKYMNNNIDDKVEVKESRQKHILPNNNNDNKESKPETDENDDNDEEGYNYNELSQLRKKIVDLIMEHLKLNTNASIAKFLAFNVESSINKVHDSIHDNKSYLNKAKSLAYNIKKNERLRLDIINGKIQADQVAHLSANDLATDELKGMREETAKQAEMARRGDLYEITRSEILKSNGIDPNAGGEFVCRKCKGTKCTHYSMQTRSSDEPMTVFVCCLTCGKRWRE